MMPAAEALPHACDERPLTLAVSGWEVPAALTLLGLPGETDPRVAAAVDAWVRALPGA